MPDQLRVLSEWGAEIRTFKPHSSLTSLMHAKSWLVDDAVAAICSANATENSLERCYEMLVVTRSLEVTRDLRSAFDALWQGGEPLDLNMLPEPGAVRRSRSQSFSRSASAERAPVERSRSSSVIK